MKSWTKAILSLALLSPLICAKALWPKPSCGSFSIEDFTFDSGEIIDSLNISYQTLGELKVNSDGSNNAVVLLHGTTGSSAQFLVEEFAGALFNPGQPLDANEYFIIMRDAIGHGNSSKPSNTGLRASFPKYQYPDMIRADHLLLTEHFKLNRTRLTLGVSMGGMHTWMMGGEYPGFSDALMPIASFPVEIAGHNQLFRKFITEILPLIQHGKVAIMRSSQLLALAVHSRFSFSCFRRLPTGSEHSQPVRPSITTSTSTSFLALKSLMPMINSMRGTHHRRTIPKPVSRTSGFP